MRYKSLLYLVPVTFFMSCAGGKKAAEAPSDIKLPASFLSQVVIDGKPDEWAAVPKDFSPRSTLQLSVANNSDNLFVLLRVPGQTEQMKLLQGGMDVWIDAQGTKNKKTGISYPVKGELPEQEHRVISPGEKPDVKQQRLQMAGQLISLNRFGFKEEFNGVQSIRQNTGFRAALSWDDNDVMNYELCIPFRALPVDWKGSNIAIGFNIHGVERPKNPRAENEAVSEGGGMGGHGGRRGGGNFGNGRRTDIRAATTAYNQKEKLYIPETFWTAYTVGRQ